VRCIPPPCYDSGASLGQANDALPPHPATVIARVPRGTNPGASAKARGETPNVETNLAVLIDFENIAAGTEKEGLGRFDVESLMRHIKDKGRILLARSYADWGRFSRFKQSLLAANVTMMELTSHGMQDKNRADIAMVVDALELAFTKDFIQTYVVVSGDSDFTPMVLKMRELNKRVIGIGTRKSTSRLLIQACDEFTYYDTLVQEPRRSARRSRKPSSSSGGEKSKAHDLLEETLGGLLRQNPDPPLASIVKTAMLRKSPDFSENELGFSSFARFLESAQEKGIIRIRRDRKSGGYRVESTDSPPDPDADDDILLVTEGPAWKDEYLPEGSEPFVEALAKVGLHPLAAPTRLAVLEALEQVVAEREKRRRKTTLKFVADDVQKHLRRTHPDLPPALLKGLLDGLLRAGELIHRDGTAIRSSTAPFGLVKDAAGLNDALVRLFLQYLKDNGAELAKTDVLAHLMYGDAERRREVEETLAYMVANEDADDSPEGDDSTEQSLDLNLDDLLLTSPVAETEEAPVEEKPKPKRKSRAKKKPDPPAEEAPAEEDAAAEAEAVEEKPKPKRKSRAKKKEPEAPAEAPAKDEVKPKPRVRRRVKKEEPAAEPAAIDLDSLLESAD